MISQQLFHGQIDADVHAAMEGNALTLDLLDATINEVLFHLEVRNTVAQQPAGLALTLIDMNLMASATQLLGSGETGRTEPMTATFLPVWIVGGCGAIKPSS